MRPSSSISSNMAPAGFDAIGSDSDIPDHSPALFWGPHAWFQLSFADQELEDTFTHHNDVVLAGWDELFCTIHLSSLLLFLLALELGWLGSTEAGRYWTAATAAVVGTQFFISRYVRSPTLTAHRLAYIMSFRLLVTLTAPLYVREFFPLTTGISSFIAGIFITSCGPMGVWQGLGMPVLYRYHMLIQLVSITIFGYIVNGSICQRIAQTPLAQDALSSVWNALDSTFAIIADIYFPFYQRYTRKQLPSCQCLPVVVMMQFVVGYVAPTCMLYYMECSTRIGFLRSRFGTRHQVMLPNAGLIPNWIGKLLGLSLVLFACTTVWLVTDSYVAAVSSGQC